MIAVRGPEEIEKLRRAGDLVARTLDLVESRIAPGVTTGELDTLAREWIESEGGRPAFLGYHGYPATLCVSIDDEVVHGIPGKRLIRDGMIVSVDVGAVVEGYYGDSARTVPVGTVPPEAQRLLDVTRQALAEGIAAARPGRRVGAIGAAVSAVAKKAGFGVVRALTGHGIGTAMHEPPQIPNFGSAEEGDEIKAGMVFAIEPMLNAGDYRVEFMPDGWTVKTKDGSLSAHFEHTIVVTNGAPEVLTLPARVAHG
jgi:methionyl aminopeptidase